MSASTWRLLETDSETSGENSAQGSGDHLVARTEGMQHRIVRTDYTARQAKDIGIITFTRITYDTS